MPCPLSLDLPALLDSPSCFVLSKKSEKLEETYPFSLRTTFKEAVKEEREFLRIRY